MDEDEPEALLLFAADAHRLHPQSGWVQKTKKLERGGYLTEYRTCARADIGYDKDTDNRDQSQHKAVFNHSRAVFFPEKSFDFFHCSSPLKLFFENRLSLQKT